MLNLKSYLLQYSPETKQQICKYYDLDRPEKMDEAVGILEDWIRKQNHFRQKTFRRHFLEMVIVQSKGSIERAKSRLDNYCTMKTILPRFFEQINPKTDLEDMNNTLHCVVLPKLTPDHHRVVLTKIFDRNLSSAIIMQAYKVSVMINEFGLGHDWHNGIELIFDLLDMDLRKIFAALNLVDLRDLFKVQMECFGIRLKGFHLVTASSMVQGLVTLLRQFLSEKLSQRIHVHKDLESLFKMLPKEHFPEEYGGKERSLLDIREDWIQLFDSEEYATYAKEMREATTNEEKRDTYEFNSKYLGQPGTFRYMNLD